MIGQASQMCGWCPTAGKAFVKIKQNDKWVPKYPEDKCNGMGGYGLLSTPADCIKFGQDHPCLTPKYLVGQHSDKCYQDQWKKSKCTANSS